MDLVKVKAVDETGVLDVTFFNQTWLKNNLRQGETYIFYGKAEGNRPGQPMRCAGKREGSLPLPGDGGSGL